MFSSIISLVPSVCFSSRGTPIIHIFVALYIYHLLYNDFLLHVFIILSWHSKLLTLFSAETILLAASEIVLGETAVSSLEAGSYFPDQELDLGILDENQES